MNTKALFKLSYGLYVISTKDNNKTAGCVANTLMQVTSNPVQLSITLNKDNETTKLIQSSNKFNAVALCKDVDMAVIRTFGFYSSRDVDKFVGFEVSYAQNEVPYLVKDVACFLSCKVVNQVDLGSHIMFVGVLEEAEILSDKEVMTYAYYHEVKNGTTPKNASSYQEEIVEDAYVCDICQYVYEDGEVPEDYICPICKADASHFKKK